MSEMWKRVNTAAWRGLPGDPEQNGLAIEGLLSAGGPDALGDQVLDSRDARGRARCGWRRRRSSFPRWACRLRLTSIRRLATIIPWLFVSVHFFQLPDFALALAVAGLVFEEEDVVLGGGGAGATVARVLCPVVDRQHRHGGDLWVRREKGSDVQHRAERDIPEIRRCAVIADDAVGKHGEGVRRVSENVPSPCTRIGCRGGWHDPRTPVRRDRSAPFREAETSLPRGGTGSFVLSACFCAGTAIAE